MSLAVAGLAVLGLIGLGVLTFHQVRVWHDTETLWAQALSVDAESPIALNNFGNVLLGKGELAEASRYFQEALRLKRDYAEPHYNLGVVLAREGKLSEAVEHYLQALSLRPTFEAARRNLDAVLRQMGESHGVSSSGLEAR